MVDECGGGFVGEIEEGYAGALQGEVFDGCGAYALSASGDEDHFVGEAWIGREDGRWVHRESGVAIGRWPPEQHKEHTPGAKAPFFFGPGRGPSLKAWLT